MKRVDSMVPRLVSKDIFLYVFGREETKDLLMDLVNTVLEDSAREPVVDIELVGPDSDRDVYKMQETVIDALATARDGSKFDLEVMVSIQPASIKRYLHAWSELYMVRSRKNWAYGRFKPAVSINLLDFVMFPESVKSHCRMEIANERNPEIILSDDFQLHFVELTKALPGESRLSDWITVLENTGKEGFNMNHEVFRSGDVFTRAYTLYRQCVDDESLPARPRIREP